MPEEAIEAPEIDVDDVPDGTFTANEDVETPEYEEAETDGKATDKAKKTQDGGDKGADADNFKTRFDELEKNYQRASTHIEDLNKAISSLRRENKELKKGGGKQDGDEAVFTDAQLLGIIEENKDDPGVMLQAMKQLVKQGAMDIQKLTDKKVDLSRKQGEVESVMGGWKNYLESNQDTIDKVVDYHGLQDMPDWQRNHLALGAMLVTQWPKMVESIKEQTKKELLGDKTENARKSAIRDGKPETGGQDADPGAVDIKQSWIESADRLGLKGKKRDAYFDLMKKSSKKKE